MRHFTFFLVIVICTLSCDKSFIIDSSSPIVEVKEVKLDITLNTPGKLYDEIKKYDSYNITSLKISGVINGADLKVIRLLSGNDEYGNQLYGSLRNLDLSDAAIVAGGGYFLEMDGSKYECTDNEIPTYAFYRNYTLETISLPCIQSLGHGCFSKCENLKSVMIPDADNIPDYCFWECYELESINAPAVRHIGESAFEECSKLRSVTFSSQLEEISSRAFYNCKNLEEIDLSNVKTIGNYAFTGTDKLTSVEFSDSLTDIGDYAFAVMYTLPNGRGLGGALILPKSLNYIGAGAFMQVNVSSVEINSDIDTPSNTIGALIYGVFWNCESLKSVAFNKGVTRIHIDFNSCDSLSDIHFPSTLESIGSQSVYESIDGDIIITDHGGIFSYCKSLKKVTLPASLKVISHGTFSSCDSLESISIPYGVEYINRGTFNGCKALKRVDLPSTIRIIDSHAFMDCTSLEHIDIPQSVTELRSNIFENCESLTSVNVPDQVISIDESCFEGCTKLRSIVIGPNVKSIGENCFNNCTSLETIVLGEDITNIKAAAFYHCSNLKSVNLPISVTDIGSKAFAYTSLNEVTVNWHIPLTVPVNLFEGTSIEKARLLIPSGTKDLYSSSPVWQRFGYIEEF